MDNINQLWKLVVNYGYSIRIYNAKPDGLVKWNIIKTLLSEIPIKGKWSTSSLELYNQIKGLGVQDVEPKEMSSHELWEKHHFYIQHGRIPHLNQNDPSLTRLIQIAFNVGQLKYFMDYKNDPFYTNEMRQFYKSNKLNNIETYMDTETLQSLNNNISTEFVEKVKDSIANNLIDKQKGGSNKSYQCKYNKYKSKYLALRWKN